MLALRPLQRYLDFAGRSGRAEYWQWVALSFVASWVAKIMDKLASPAYGPPTYTITTLLALATVVPALAVGFRRLHDIGRSGWPFAITFGVLCLDALVILSGMYIQQQTGAEFLLDVGILGALVWLALSVYLFILLAKPGDLGPNVYGSPDAFAAAAPPLGAYVADLQARMHTGASSSDAKITTLERLARLHADGHLSDAEFAEQKRRLLGTGGTPSAARDPIAPMQPGSPTATVRDAGGSDA